MRLGLQVEREAQPLGDGVSGGGFGGQGHGGLSVAMSGTLRGGKLKT
ncbi:hypothetical protein [Niveibacterium sp. SC-1]